MCRDRVALAVTVQPHVLVVKGDLFWASQEDKLSPLCSASSSSTTLKLGFLDDYIRGS